MKVKVNGLIFLIYGLLTSIYLLIINGTIRVNIQIQADGYAITVSIINIILLVLGIAVIISSVIFMKDMEKADRNCSLIGMAVAVCNVAAALFMGGVTIFSVICIATGIVLIVRKR